MKNQDNMKELMECKKIQLSSMYGCNGNMNTSRDELTGFKKIQLSSMYGQFGGLVK